MNKRIISNEELEKNVYYQAGYHCGFCVGPHDCYKTMTERPDQKQAYIKKTHNLLGIPVDDCLTNRMTKKDIDYYFVGYRIGRTAHGSGAWVYASQQNAQAIYNLENQRIRMPYTFPIWMIEDFRDACTLNRTLPIYVLEDFIREYIDKNKLDM